MGLTALAFDRDGNRLATGASDKTIRIWDIRNWEPGRVGRPELLQTLRHEGPVTSIAFGGPADRWLAAGSEDRRVTIWEPGSEREVLKLRGHAASVEQVAFSPDGARVASASNDQTV